LIREVRFINQYVLGDAVSNLSENRQTSIEVDRPRQDSGKYERKVRWDDREEERWNDREDKRWNDREDERWDDRYDEDEDDMDEKHGRKDRREPCKKCRCDKDDDDRGDKCDRKDRCEKCKCRKDDEKDRDDKGCKDPWPIGTFPFYFLLIPVIPYCPWMCGCGKDPDKPPRNREEE
jgi:hypothetical protein